jgi:RNA polymerase sigma-70 factor (ECF subfamily)
MRLSKPVAPAPACPDEPSDATLLQRFRQGDEAAAAQLYLRYAHRVMAVARAQCSNQLAARLDAEDIVQSVFRTFFHEARQGFYDVPAGEDLWRLLLVIALNKVRAKGAFHKAAKRDVRLTMPLGESHSSAGTLKDPKDCAAAFLHLVVDEALQCLDSRQRHIVELRLQGYAVAEIADKTGRSKRSIERHLQEIRTKLSRYLPIGPPP